MRMWACFTEPITYDEQEIRKIMLYETPEEETYVFLYKKEDSQICFADEFYPTLEDALDQWDYEPHTEWNVIDDAIPGCQHDAIQPVRVKGRAEGDPNWGEFEILKDGAWVDYRE